MKITVIGEICDDIFVYGNCNRLCPEAPVPIFNILYTKTNNGMGGNVVNNLSVINKDVDILFFYQPEKITKTRYVDDKSNQMILRIDEGEGNILPLNLNETIIKAIKISDLIIVSDYNKGFLNEDVLIKIGNLSKLSILDTKKTLSQELIESFTFIKLNEHEYNNNSNITNKNLNKLIITLGVVGSKHNDIIYPSPKPIQTMDVSGAGDTFTASFILKYYETRNIRDSILFANEMSSIVVSKRGVSTP